MIVHAIQTIKRLLFIIKTSFIYIILLSSCAPIVYKDYRIDKAWFDGSGIYVKYLRNNNTSIWIPFIVHDEFSIFNRNNYFIYRLPRSELLQTKITIDLNDAAPIKKNIIYKDNDFSIEINVDNISDKSKASIIYGKNKTTTLLNCNEIWFLGPIRINEQLFYCGVLFDQSGEIILKIPDTIIKLIQTDYRDRLKASGDSESNVNLFKYAIQNNKLHIIGGAEPGLANSTLRFAVWPLNGSADLSWQEIPLSIKPEFDMIDNGANTYSPSRFVVKPGSEAKVILICEETKCDEVLFNDKSVNTYLIVDGSKRQLITLKQQDDSSSSLDVFLTSY